MKMKKVMGLSLAVVMAAGLAACGGGSDKEASTGGNEKKEADSGKKTITFCFRDDGQGEDGALWKWIQNGYDTWDKKDTVELNIAPIVAQAVSYTHLDVYKRQQNQQGTNRNTAVQGRTCRLICRFPVSPSQKPGDIRGSPVTKQQPETHHNLPNGKRHRDCPHLTRPQSPHKISIHQIIQGIDHHPDHRGKPHCQKRPPYRCAAQQFHFFISFTHNHDFCNGTVTNSFLFA